MKLNDENMEPFTKMTPPGGGNSVDQHEEPLTVAFTSPPHVSHAICFVANPSPARYADN